MEDPVVCADGHSYERAAISHWLLAKETSPCTNAALPHKNVVPNHALRNLIAEVRGVRRPITLEEHLAAATPCAPEELDDGGDSTASATAGSHEGVEELDGGEGERSPPRAAARRPSAARRDDETSAAPVHAAEAEQLVDPCAVLCVQSAIGRRAVRPRPAGKNALHWAMVEGAQAEQRQLRLLLHPELAAQPDQGGNLPLHYAASSGVTTASLVACALAFMPGIDWANKTGRTPLDIARLEGHLGLAAVLSGMPNRHSNDLHAAFRKGAAAEAEQLRLLSCRPELAGQKDPECNLPLHIAATCGATPRAVQECIRVYPDAPHRRNSNGFFPHQLAAEGGHRSIAEILATCAGKRVKVVNSILSTHLRSPQGAQLEEKHESSASVLSATATGTE